MATIFFSLLAFGWSPVWTFAFLFAVIWYGRTAMNTASDNGKTATVKLLLEAGADVGCSDLIVRYNAILCLQMQAYVIEKIAQKVAHPILPTLPMPILLHCCVEQGGKDCGYVYYFLPELPCYFLFSNFAPPSINSCKIHNCFLVFTFFACLLCRSGWFDCVDVCLPKKPHWHRRASPSSGGRYECQEQGTEFEKRKSPTLSEDLLALLHVLHFSVTILHWTRFVIPDDTERPNGSGSRLWKRLHRRGGFPRGGGMSVRSSSYFEWGDIALWDWDSWEVYRASASNDGLV